MLGPSWRGRAKWRPLSPAAGIAVALVLLLYGAMMIAWRATELGADDAWYQALMGASRRYRFSVVVGLVMLPYYVMAWRSEPRKRPTDYDRLLQPRRPFR